MMFGSIALRRAAWAAPAAQRSLHRPGRSFSNKAKSNSGDLNWSYAVIALVSGAGAYWGLKIIQRNHPFRAVDAEAPAQSSDIISIIDKPIFEEPRPRVASKEENRDLISSQHLQVKRSWENPGLYAWGLNSGRVAAPDSDERWIKTPRRIPFFDGVLLRDVKLDNEFGAAIDEYGNLLQWGVGYAPDLSKPEMTLKGKNLRSLAISDDRIIGLSDSGTVYSLPVSRKQQQSDPKLKETSWFWTSSSTDVACRDITPKSLGIGERVTSVAGGLEHVLLLTSRGRVYSAAASTKDYPKHGQLGIPGLNWYTRPQGPFDQCYEVTALRGHNVKKIAAGDTHSLVLDSHGNVFSFGDNSHGQLGHDLNPEGLDLENVLNIQPHIVDIPTLVPFSPLYEGVSQAPKVTTIAAGGQNSYFVVDAKPTMRSSTDRSGRVQSDTWSCGRGIWGNLGNGKWTHVQWTPTKIQILSGLSEYNERTGRAEPIRVGHFSVGQTHTAAIMSNITRVAADSKTGENDTNYGADIFFFGNNENFQLGTGKRANLSSPSYIQPLDMDIVPGLRLQRFQITPGKKVKFNGRSVWLEQRVECGRGISAVYSGV